jgi:hypothetical protein
MNAGLEQLEQWMSAIGLITPPMPAGLTESIHRQSEHVFSSRDDAVSPYNFHHYCDEALLPRLADYVLVGHAGHGANSYGLSYYAVSSGVRVLLQLAWGGTNLDHEDARQIACNVFQSLHEIWHALEARDAAQPTILVAHSDFYGGLAARDGVRLDSWHGPGGPDRAIAHLRRELA